VSNGEATNLREALVRLLLLELRLRVGQLRRERALRRLRVLEACARAAELALVRLRALLRVRRALLRERERLARRRRRALRVRHAALLVAEAPLQRGVLRLERAQLRRVGAQRVQLRRLRVLHPRGQRLQLLRRPPQLVPVLLAGGEALVLGAHERRRLLGRRLLTLGERGPRLERSDLDRRTSDTHDQHVSCRPTWVRSFSPDVAASWTSLPSAATWPSLSAT
jgi:hypothetical protein